MNPSRTVAAIEPPPSRQATSGKGRAVGLAMLTLLLLVAVCGPWIAGVDAISQNLERVREAPSAAHWLGTDHLGRDQLARLGNALRLSLTGAALSVLVAATMGCTLGLAAAWRGGWPERFCVTLADAVLALPGLLLVLLITAFAPGQLAPLYLGLALAMWVEYFRVVRAMSQNLLASPQVEAARLLGFGTWYVVRRHVAPELLPVVATLMCFGSATAILAMAALGFVGVGLQPPTPELGLVLIELLPYYAEAPWLIATPIAGLALLLMALALLAGRQEPM